MTLTVDEAEAEEDAAQTRVRKGSAQPTEEQIMKHNASHFLLASRKKCQTGHTHGGPDVTAGLFLPESSWRHGHFDGAELLVLSLGRILRAALCQGPSEPRCPNGHDVHGLLDAQE